MHVCTKTYIFGCYVAPVFCFQRDYNEKKPYLTKMHMFERQEFVIILHSERPKLYNFGFSECNRATTDAILGPAFNVVT